MRGIRSQRRDQSAPSSSLLRTWPSSRPRSRRACSAPAAAERPLLRRRQTRTPAGRCQRGRPLHLRHAPAVSALPRRSDRRSCAVRGRRGPRRRARRRGTGLWPRPSRSCRGLRAIPVPVSTRYVVPLPAVSRLTILFAQFLRGDSYRVSERVSGEVLRVQSSGNRLLTRSAGVPESACA